MPASFLLRSCCVVAAGLLLLALTAAPATPHLKRFDTPNTGDRVDPDESNNQDAIDERTIAEADLELKMVGPEEAVVGVPFTYNITVTNNGPDASPITYLGDILPEGVAFQSVTSTRRRGLRSSWRTRSLSGSRFTTYRAAGWRCCTTGC